MKTMKKARVIERVPEELVASRLSDGWKFCSKEEWKKKVRDKSPVKKTKKQSVEKGETDGQERNH